SRPVADPRSASLGDGCGLALGSALACPGDPDQPDHRVCSDRPARRRTGSGSLERSHLRHLGDVYPLESRCPGGSRSRPAERSRDAPLAPCAGSGGLSEELCDEARGLGLDFSHRLLPRPGASQGESLWKRQCQFPAKLLEPAALRFSKAQAAPVRERAGGPRPPLQRHGRTLRGRNPMKHWLSLIVSSLCEVGWVVSLRMTDGFSRIVPLIGYAVFGLGAAVFLSFSMKAIPMATAYAIWMGISVVGTLIVDV